MSMIQYKTRADVAETMKEKGTEYFVALYAVESMMPDEEVRKAFRAAEDAYEKVVFLFEQLEELVGLK